MSEANDQIRSAEEAQLKNVLEEALHLPGAEYLVWSENFTKKRLEELTGQSSPKEISATSPIETDFIHPESEVKPLFIGRGFNMNDPKIYESFMRTLKNFYEMGLEKTPEDYRKLILNSVQYGIQDYFGHASPPGDAEIKRHKRLWDSATLSIDDENNPLPVSIAEIKDEGLCTERAAVAHNLLKFCGVESYFVNGKLNAENAQEDLHSYVILKNSQGDLLIYDPTHLHLLVDESGKPVFMQPFIFPGGEKILAGETVRTEKTNYKKTPLGLEPLETKVYEYFPPLSP
jgi:hypothetical protein